MSTSTREPPDVFSAVTYSRAGRIATGILVFAGWASHLGILVLLAVAEGPVNPLTLLRLFVAGCILPATAVGVIHALGRTEVWIHADRIEFVIADRHVEIPSSALDRIEPWSLPLPGNGVDLHLAGGARYEDSLEVDDARALARMLDDRANAAALLRHPTTVWAAARRISPRPLLRWLLSVPGFALVPTIPLFRVHQIIAYGGAFGEYQQYGWGAYFAGFAIYWVTLTIYLDVYRAALRLPVEILAYGAAWLRPSSAEPARRLGERLAAVLYYGGIVVVLVLRFVPW